MCARIGLVYLVFAAILGCGDSTTSAKAKVGLGDPSLTENPSVTGEVISASLTSGPQYGYDGALGPEHWGTLAPEWSLCEDGDAQTPIDLVSHDVTRIEAAELDWDYEATPLAILNNGHTLQFEYESGSFLEIDDERYELLQMHWHTPSEHLSNGESLELELHLVHRNAVGQLAVLGVWATEGEANDELADLGPLSTMLPLNTGETHAVDGLEISAEGLLPENHSTFRYIGSLTTPPCTEGVRWFVFDEPLTLSAEQIATLQEALGALEYVGSAGNNNRPVQSHNARTVNWVP